MPRVREAMLARLDESDLKEELLRFNDPATMGPFIERLAAAMACDDLAQPLEQAAILGCDVHVHRAFEAAGDGRAVAPERAQRVQYIKSDYLILRIYT